LGEKYRFIGILLFFVPGVLLIVLFSIAIYIYLVEELEGIDALLQSKAYVEKYWFSVLGRLSFDYFLLNLFFLCSKPIFI
jgi:hypothetical protein